MTMPEFTREQRRILGEQQVPSLIYVHRLESAGEAEFLMDGQPIQFGLQNHRGLLVHELPHIVTAVARGPDDTIVRYEAREDIYNSTSIAVRYMRPGEPKYEKYDAMLKEFSKRCRRAPRSMNNESN